MKRKDVINQGTIRKLTDAETMLIVGGYNTTQCIPTAKVITNLTINYSKEGRVKGSISLERKNKELVPTTGVELTTY